LDSIEFNPVIQHSFSLYHQAVHIYQPQSYVSIATNTLPIGGTFSDRIFQSLIGNVIDIVFLDSFLLKERIFYLILLFLLNFLFKKL